MPAAFEWDKVMGLDPASLRECEKDQVEEVFGMFALVNVHTITPQIVCSVAQPANVPWF